MKCLLLCLLVCSLMLFACAPTKAQQPVGQLEQVIDHITANEKSLVERWSQYTPIAETYIQELAPHGDRLVVVRDHYFLSQAKVGSRVDIAPFKGTYKGNRVGHLAGSVFDVGMQYIPAGFVQMAHPSMDNFDRQHYTFRPIESGPLDTGTLLVFEVAPLPKFHNREGMFNGEIWVEPETYTIVRYRGVFGEPGNLHGMVAGYYFRFDTSRFYAGNGLWLPRSTYSEELDFGYNSVGYKRFSVALGHNRFRAETRFWRYEERSTSDGFAKPHSISSEFIGLKSQQFLKPDETSSTRTLAIESENNVINRLEQIGLLAPRGEWDAVLQAIVAKLDTAKHRQVQPTVRCRELLTTRMEFFTVGHTIVVSRGLLDVVPNESVLAGVIALGLARIELMYPPNTAYAFSDRVLFDPQDVFLKMNFASPANLKKKIAELAEYYVSRSPYSLPSVQSFSAQIEDLSSRFPELLKPNLGDGLLPQLSFFQHNIRSPVQIQNWADHALPLNSRTSINPQTNILEALYAVPTEPLPNVPAPLEIVARPLSEPPPVTRDSLAAGPVRSRIKDPEVIRPYPGVTSIEANFRPASSDRVAFKPDRRPKLVMGGGFGVDTQLGYKFPTVNFTAGIEVPFAHRFEAQASGEYSIARKFITGDGHSSKVNGSLIVWAKRRIGLIATAEHSWLSTSQFKKDNFFPSAGIVLRGQSLGPGRIYLTYLIPTGCVWATSTNPCAIQSNRLQGLSYREEDRVWSRIRLGFGFSIFHFCDQGNPYARQVGRSCHMAMTMSGDFRFALPLLKRRNHETYDFY